MYILERAQTGVVSRIVLAIRDSRTRRGAIRELRRMSDLQLADIGIERQGIPKVVDDLMARNAASTKTAGSVMTAAPRLAANRPFLATRPTASST